MFRLPFFQLPSVCWRSFWSQIPTSVPIFTRWWRIRGSSWRTGTQALRTSTGRWRPALPYVHRPRFELSFLGGNLRNALTWPVTPFRIHIEEINQTVLMHMTEKMSYKHSEVLSAVLTNRACHTLAVYFLLNKKMKRLSKEYRVSLFSNTNPGHLSRSDTQRPEILKRHIYTGLKGVIILMLYFLFAQFKSRLFFYAFRKCSSRRKKRGKNKKVSISRPSGGSTWTSSPSLRSRPPSTWPWARGPVRKRNTELVSSQCSQQRGTF